MKRCDHCGKNAVVFYQMTVNGKTEQKNLCADCARKEGIPMDFRSPFEQGSSLFPESILNAFESPLSLFSSDLFAVPRGTGLPEPDTQAQSESDADLRPKTQDAEIPVQSSPSLATLKAQLKHALKQEDYLRAASLRDQIRALEGK